MKSPNFLNFWQACFLFSISFLLIPILIISIARISSPSFLYNAAVDECPLGRVYAYNLPSIFNHDLLLRNCTDLHPSIWQCGISPNHGFGRPATELCRILPENTRKSWFRTNQFALELLFHRRVLRHRCRTRRPESASAFYIPFYAGLAVGNHLWTNDTAQQMLRWVQSQSHWMKSNGSNHFITIGRITWLADPVGNWGSALLNMPEMSHVTRLIIEKATWDDHDVGVPYPTGFHPETGQALKNWQQFLRGYNRSSLFAFAGATRQSSGRVDFRGLLLSYCANETASCQAVDCAAAKCSADYTVILEAFLGAEFCLQPAGDSSTRRSVFDCMVAGSVPVFFWNSTAYEQYKWFLPGEPESYSVYINHEEVRNRSYVIEQVLRRYSKEEIREKREKVIETIPRIIYGRRGSLGFKDAFDIAFDGVLQRIKTEKEGLNINKKNEA
ncbi:xyloglucan galactosyltransferase XLT2-like [Salvia hispanica]|uniref:xyloglucan galactosyltransferase XLT2-like n=1 Tax=Salvia hispanica TaxID=49212 RepID=UPI0020094266|nr:xyloglucan galactosyltransferase XLT2-like [Salvia hispanica]